MKTKRILLFVGIVGMMLAGIMSITGAGGNTGIPTTGDDSNIWIYVLLGATALVGVLLTILKRKK